MHNYKTIRLVYTCSAAVPSNVYMDRTYSLNKDKNGLYFTDGNYVEYCTEDYVKMLFTPVGVEWDKVTFEDEVIKKK